jgi:hypothetical protein
VDKRCFLERLRKHAPLGNEDQVGQSIAVGKSSCLLSVQLERPSLAAVSNHLRLHPTTLFSMLWSLPHGLPRVGAHEAKRDQPVELFRKERVTKAETESDRLCSRARRASYLSVLEQSSAPQARTCRPFGNAGDYCVESRAQRQEKGLGEILQAIYRMMGDKIRRRLVTVAGKGNNIAVIVSIPDLFFSRSLFWSGPTWRLDASRLPPQSNCSPNLKPLPSEGLPRKSHLQPSLSRGGKSR